MIKEIVVGVRGIENNSLEFVVLFVSTPVDKTLTTYFILFSFMLNG